MGHTVGYLKGDVCNRNGCVGIIDEHTKDGSCSCHINPPCSYCTSDNNYCPSCDWQGEEEQKQVEKSRPVYKNDFRPRELVDLDRNKLDWISRSHTHFTMIKEGFYPEGMAQEEVRKEVNGTFGGRFEYFKDGKFKFIAYTD